METRVIERHSLVVGWDTQKHKLAAFHGIQHHLLFLNIIYLECLR